MAAVPETRSLHSALPGGLLLLACCNAREPPGDPTAGSESTAAMTSDTEETTAVVESSSGGGGSTGSTTIGDTSGPSSGDDGPTSSSSDATASTETDTETSTTGGLKGCGDSLFPPDMPPFGALTVLDDTANNPTALALGDLDDDGDLDIVYGEYGDGEYGLGGARASGVYVALNDGNGVFDTPARLEGDETIPANLDVAALADGTVDVVALCFAPSDDVWTWRGSGDGAFDAPVTYEVALTNSFSSLHLADLDGDASQDLLYAPEGTTAVRFVSEQEMLADDVPLWPGFQDRYFEAADFDADGDVDIVVVNGPGGVPPTLTPLLNLGDGTFATGPQLPALVDDIAGDVASGDFDGDGHLDLFAASGSGVSVWSGEGNGGFAAAEVIPLLVGTSLIAVTDFDHDGCSDVVGHGEGTTYLTISLGDGEFVDPENLTEGGPTVAVRLVTGDVDGDAIDDLLLAYPAPLGQIVAYLSGG